MHNNLIRTIYKFAACLIKKRENWNIICYTDYENVYYHRKYPIRTILKKKNIKEKYEKYFKRKYDSLNKQNF